MKRSARKRSGFTLAELLVVLTILMILGGLVSVNVIRHAQKAKVQGATVQVKLLASAIRQYQMEQGRIPTMDQGLDALVRKPAKPPVPADYPAEGYLVDTRVIPLDPWGRPYQYVVPGRGGMSFEVYSLGSDGEPGGEGDAADISNIAGAGNP